MFILTCEAEEVELKKPCFDMLVREYCWAKCAKDISRVSGFELLNTLQVRFFLLLFCNKEYVTLLIVCWKGKYTY